MRRALRITAWSLLGFVLLVTLALGGCYLYLRSPSGRDRALALALRALDGLLIPGGVSVGWVEGDLATGIVLHDVVVRDLEHEPAIVAARLEVRYELAPLLARRLRVTKLVGSGVLVISRALADGRDNLATIARVAPRDGTASTQLPFAVSLEELVLEARFVRLQRHTSLARAPADSDVRFTAHGRADLSRALTLHVDGLAIELHTPARARVDASGMLMFLGQPSMHGVRVRVQADARELHRRVKGIELRGPIVASVEMEGPFDQPRAKLRLRADEHALRVEAEARLGSDRALVTKLELVAPFAKLGAHGVVHFDGHYGVEGRAKVSDLSALAVFGLPKMSGIVELDANVRDERDALRMKFIGTIRDLAVTTVRVRSAAVDVETVDLTGHARLTARGVDLAGAELRAAQISAESTDTQAKLAITATGPEQTSLSLALHGKPRKIAGRVLGIDGELTTLLVALTGSTWRLRAPAKFSADVPTQTYGLDRVELDNEQQQLSFEAKVRARNVEEAKFELKHFDLSTLSVVLSRGHVLPHTDLYARASMRGSIEDPQASAHLSGEAHGRSDRDTIHMSGIADATLAAHRVIGEAFITIGGQKVNAHVDLPMPFRPRASVSASLDASVLLSPTFSELLVPKLIQFQPLFMYLLSGTVTAHAQLSGTTSEPTLRASARLARWEAAGAHGELGMTLEASSHTLHASAKAELSSSHSGAGSGGGVIEATTVLPFELASLLDGTHRAIVAIDAPLHASVDLHHVGIDHLPLRALNIIPPLQHGTIDGHAELAGTLARPLASAKLDARDFDAVRAGVGKLGLHATAALTGRSLRLKGSLTVHDTVALEVEGSVDAGSGRRSEASAWRDAKLSLTGQSNGFDLGKLDVIRGLGGSLHAQGRVGGSLAALDSELDLHVDGLLLGASRYSRFAAKVRIADDRLLASIHAAQPGGAELEGEARVPLSGGPISGSLVARGFLLDLNGDSLPRIRTLRGVLDADVKVTGTTSAPSIRGALALAHGALRISSSALDYHDIDAAMRFDRSLVEIEHLRLRAGFKGEAELTGRVQLAGLNAQSVDARLSLRKFPFQQQGIGAVLDAVILASGKRKRDGQLVGKIRIQDGHAQLPVIDQTRTLLPTGALEDVRIVADAKKPKTAGMSLGALLDGPFQIRGKEVSATARGGVSVELRDGRPSLQGALRVDQGGWIALFGRRYDLERGQLRFDGGSQPVLDFRITRRTPTATIGLNVTGALSKPALEFWSTPPVYDRAQVVGIILSGDPDTTAVSTTGLERQAVGAISSLVVKSIRANFLPELPIDVLGSDANRATAASVESSQIEVGKYLTSSLYVGYVYQLGVDRAAKAWQLGTNGGDAGGLDLYWTWRP